MSFEEIDNRIVKAIIASVIATGAVTIPDLLRTNIPKGAITRARFLRCLDIAREQDAAVATVECNV